MPGHGTFTFVKVTMTFFLDLRFLNACIIFIWSSDEPKETSDATGRDGQTFAPTTHTREWLESLGIRESLVESLTFWDSSG